MDLPNLPVPLDEFVPYLGKQKRDDILNESALGPFKTYESKLREIFAQEPSNKAIADPHVNVAPVYTGNEDHLRVKARNLEAETPQESEKYMLPLNSAFRRDDGTHAVAPTLTQFKDNFRLFSESSLVDLDWSNVVAAGSAVTTSLLPLSEEHRSSRKAQRDFYHEKIAPASDVDLFIYGLNEEQAIEKIKQIEQCIRNSVLEETTVIRTKNALTIVSKYPTRHVQIVLRLYKSISEILTGFDVDCSCTAFDGSQVWASPRALASFVTQSNTIDLTRRSPSYENRLAKYSHRGFEVYWPNLDRSKVDPTIFERSFNHVVGLARLLVMENLPSASARDSYVEQRRDERDRPPSTKQRFYRHRQGNLKDYQPEDVAEWVEDEDVSNYHTFTIPYGPKYTAKKIERLLYKKDLLLNAEWNKPKDRTVNLHRHPAFFGAVEHVIDDCCGFCPSPVTEEEIEVAKEESKRYISGRIQFMKDDPGRQAIGSFNPITDSDWTEMAYVGDTARLCQAIVDNDLEVVQNCCAQDGFDVNQRDHTGKMPLHLAIMCSTPEIVQCLVDHGARLVARVAGGYTVLHFAAARGNPEIVKTILRKSEANKEEHLEKTEKKKPLNADKSSLAEAAGDPENSEDDDISIVQSVSEGPYAASLGSMIVVKESATELENPPEEAEDEENEPNFYDNVDVPSWDTPISPLHLALLNGHAKTVDVLATEFGANVFQPIVWKKETYHSYHDVILSMALASHHPLEKAKDVLRTLLELGASSTQADMRHITAFHSIVLEGESALIDLLFELDGPAAQLAINHPSNLRSWNPAGALPLSTAAKERGLPMVKKLLEHGASLSATSERLRRLWARHEKDTSKTLEGYLAQPIIVAAQFGNPAVIKALLDAGSDINALTPASHAAAISKQLNGFKAQSLLDIIDVRIKYLEDPPEVIGFGHQSAGRPCPEPPKLRPDAEYLEGLVEGSYEHCYVLKELEIAKAAVRKMTRFRKEWWANHDKKLEKQHERDEWVKAELHALEEIKEELLAKGAKGFYDLHPEFKEDLSSQRRHQNYVQMSHEIDETTVPSEKEFAIERAFRDSDIGEVDNESYMQLFEATWAGDIEKLKSLTLSSCEDGKKKSPLRVTVRDKRGTDPFTIAVGRGHYKLAEAILEIAAAQYAPKPQEATRKKFEVVVDAEADSEYSDSDSETGEAEDDNHGVAVRFDVINEQHTIDDIRETGNIVKSSISPSDLVLRCSNMRLFLEPASYKDMVKQSFSQCCSTNFGFYIIKQMTSLAFLDELCELKYVYGEDLLTHAITKNDLALAKFVIEKRSKYQTKDGGKMFIHLSTSQFDTAVKLGHTDLLGYLISQTGAEFPFQSLMKKAGVAPEVKTKTYQGLTVYGSKRADWAAEGGAGHRSYTPAEENLLLRAAYNGNLDSIKWFLSDVPRQKYKEFAASFADDEDVKSIANIPGGFDGVLASWLNAQRDMALHCAVLSTPTKETGNAHVELILNAIPNSLDAKNTTTGLTPSQTAFAKRRIMAARALVKAGADQTARDSKGRNMLHQILCQPNHNVVMKSVAMFKALAEILDKDVLETLAVQRSHVSPGSSRHDSWGMQTPLAEWLNMRNIGDSEPEMLRAILEVTGTQALYILDGTGNYPIHDVVRRKRIQLVRIMLEADPKLALLENATGVTPLELAENKLISSILSTLKQGSTSLITAQAVEDWNGTPTMYQSLFNNQHSQHYYRASGQPQPSYKDIYRGKLEDKHRVSTVEREDRRLFHLLRETAVTHDVKRQLVTLQDANQLVKRLEGRKWKTFEEGSQRRTREEDLVARYIGYGWEDSWEVQEILDLEEEEKKKAGKGKESTREEESDESNEE